jgi:pyruvate,orthophosphate dikinase
MFGSVVMGIPDEPFEEVITAARRKAGVNSDSELTAEDWQKVTVAFKKIYKHHTHREFPTDPMVQLRKATEAVFKSWNGKRAIDYRNAAGIAHDLGTAVNIVTMVFGNMGDTSATGVAMTRNASTGEQDIEGDYLTNAQGEDVVAGIRITNDIQEMKTRLPKAYAEFEKICKKLENHYRDMQDVEFTVENGKLWMLQTRDGKRTAQAAVRIAVDMVEAKQKAKNSGGFLANGLNVSPGAAVGMAAFDADRAEEWGKNQNKQVIMVRPETKPDDVHGMLAAEGILTSRGGRTSHAALVARQFGTPAVVGVASLEIDLANRRMHVGNAEVKEGDWLSIDGTAGEVYREYGAQGIGLCRTEHMFFESERLPHIQKMIMTDMASERHDALEALLPFQREDFAGLFRAMDGLPVIIRLIDPPLHEFLPDPFDLMHELSDLKIRLQHAPNLAQVDDLLEQIRMKETLLKRAEALREANPMLGLRGVRLGISIPELTTMQVRAIFEAACIVAKEGVDVHPEVMIPLTSHVNELKIQREALEAEAKKVMTEQGIEVDYKFGTMIEIPRAALTADEIAPNHLWHIPRRRRIRIFNGIYIHRRSAG